MNGSANNPVCRENRLSRRAKWLYSIFKRVGDSLSSRIELLKTAPSTPVIARDSLMATKIVFGFNRCGSLCRLNRYLRRAKRPYSDYTGPGSSPTNPGPVGRGYLQYHWQLVGVIGCRLNTTRDTAFCRVNSVFRRAKRPNSVRGTPTSRAGHVVGVPVWKSSATNAPEISTLRTGTNRTSRKLRPIFPLSVGGRPPQETRPIVPVLVVGGDSISFLVLVDDLYARVGEDWRADRISPVVGMSSESSILTTIHQTSSAVSTARRHARGAR